MDAPSLSHPQALWASVADGFYVGSREGTFLGYVDRRAEGIWRGFDSASRPVGDYDDHHRAMAAVTDAADTGGLPVDGSDAGEDAR